MLLDVGSGTKKESLPKKKVIALTKPLRLGKRAALLKKRECQVYHSNRKTNQNHGILQQMRLDSHVFDL
jgi:hypothetical protein